MLRRSFSEMPMSMGADLDFVAMRASLCWFSDSLAHRGPTAPIVFSNAPDRAPLCVPELAHAPGTIRDLGRAHLLDAVHHERSVEYERALGGRAPEHQHLERLASLVAEADRGLPALPEDELARLR